MRKVRRLLFLLSLILCLVGSLFLLACGDPQTGASHTTPAVPTVMPNQPPTPAVSPTPIVTPTPLDVAHRGPHKPILTAQVNQAKQEWQALLNQAEQKWEAGQIANYEVEISYTNTTWQPIEIYHLTVKNGQVVDQINRRTDPICCVKGTAYPVIANPDVNAYTIPGLFNLLQTQLNQPWQSFYLEADFDPALGYPHSIVFDTYGAFDAYRIWRVTFFKPLP